MKKVVYHGTLERQAPHEHGYPFHAGTLKAANDRLDDEMESGVDWDPEGTGTPQIGVGQVHAYEISDNAPTSRRVWEDPKFETNKSVPEHSQTRVYPYKNAVEDKGSTSYVIPAAFVGNHVKHLNTTQFLINADKQQHDGIMSGMASMLGKPSTK